MVTTLGILEVPNGAAESGHGLFAHRRFGGTPFLDWVIRRVTDSLLLDRVVVLLDSEQAEKLQPLAPADVSVFVSPQPDALGRFAAACRQFDANDAVRVKLDCPFIDPALIDRLVCTAKANPKCDYVGYCDAGGRPTVQSTLGVFAELCRAKAIYEADRSATKSAEREDVTRYILNHTERFQLRLARVPNQLDSPDLRLTIAGEEDWENAHLIFDALGPDRLDWQAIAQLLSQQPALCRRMADLNHAENMVAAS